MKHLILAAIFFVTTCTMAFAGEGSDKKAANEAAMKAGRTELSAKIAELEQNVKNNNKAAADATAQEVLVLMRKGMVQKRAELDLAAREDQKAINAKFLGLESSTFKYMQLSDNVSANGKQLVDQAQAFMKQY